MVSPCRYCRHIGRDKSHPDCTNCTDRVAFLNGGVFVKKDTDDAPKETSPFELPDLLKGVKKPGLVRVEKKENEMEEEIPDHWPTCKGECGEKKSPPNFRKVRGNHRARVCVACATKKKKERDLAASQELSERIFQKADESKQEETAEIPAPEVPDPADDFVMTIDFRDHKDVFVRLAETAKRDLRTVHNQALYLLMMSV